MAKTHPEERRSHLSLHWVHRACALLARSGLLCCLLLLPLPSSTTRAQAALDLGSDTSLGELDDITQLDLEDLLAAPVVVSASRRAQSLHEAPAAVSVVTAEEIQRMGVRNPAEALERVVGVDVTRYSGQLF